MAKNIKEFIGENVEKGLIKRDFFIGDETDKNYLEPLAKVWKEYGIRKRDIIFLSIVIAQKYANKINKKDITNNEKEVKRSKRPIDMGRLSDFSEEELIFLISILISKYGLDDTIDDIEHKWADLRIMTEQGVRILYHKIYEGKIIDTEIFNTIFNLDKELKI